MFDRCLCVLPGNNGGLSKTKPRDQHKSITLRERPLMSHLLFLQSVDEMETEVGVEGEEHPRRHKRPMSTMTSGRRYRGPKGVLDHYYGRGTRKSQISTILGSHERIGKNLDGSKELYTVHKGCSWLTIWSFNINKNS